MIKKLIKFMGAILIFTLIINEYTFTAKASEPLIINTIVPTKEIYPGQVFDVTLALDNYASQDITDITTMKVVLNIDNSYISYVDGSVQDSAGLRQKEELYMLFYNAASHYISLQFSDLSYLVERNVTNLISFKVKVNENLPVGTTFQLGPDTFACVNGLTATNTTIPTTINKVQLSIVGAESISSVGEQNAIQNPNSITNNASSAGAGTNQITSSKTNSQGGSTGVQASDSAANNSNVQSGDNGQANSSNTENASDTLTTSNNALESTEKTLFTSKIFLIILSIVILSMISIAILNRKKIKEWFYGKKKY